MVSFLALLACCSDSLAPGILNERFFLTDTVGALDTVLVLFPSFPASALDCIDPAFSSSPRSPSSTVSCSVSSVSSP